jgi:hypothetical protein
MAAGRACGRRRRSRATYPGPQRGTQRGRVGDAEGAGTQWCSWDGEQSVQRAAGGVAWQAAIPPLVGWERLPRTPSRRRYKERSWSGSTGHRAESREQDQTAKQQNSATAKTKQQQRPGRASPAPALLKRHACWREPSCTSVARLGSSALRAVCQDYDARIQPHHRRAALPQRHRRPLCPPWPPNRRPSTRRTPSRILRAPPSKPPSLAPSSPVCRTP